MGQQGLGIIILLVEDDRLLRRMAAETLREEGYTIVEAGDPDEALDLLAARGPIDLLLTDINMPGAKNGVALACAVRSVSESLPILFISGRQPDRTALPQGSDFLQKPFTARQLLDEVSMKTETSSHAGWN